MTAGPLRDEMKARVLLLSGTGSCAWGKRRDGRAVRFGGRGHILGDQGSACDIALAALRRIVYQHDVIGKFPRLGEAVLRAVQLNDPDDLIPWTLEATKDELARLAVTIFQEERRGDAIAREVVRSAVEKLADMALHCAAHLLPRRGKVQFVLAGGVLLQQRAFAAAVRRRIHAHWQYAEIVSLRGDSVKGAVEMARALGANVQHRTKKHDAFLFDAESSRFDVRSSPVSMELLALSPTEQRNPKSMNLDTLSLTAAVELMLREDATVPRAILREKNDLVWLLRKVIAAFKTGGRLFYVGAGTSGRLGILDASECPPTFRTSPEQVQGIIAGGRRAIWNAVEGAEDEYEGGAVATRHRGVRKGDVVLGIAASGRTPFVWGALHEAKRQGAVTALLSFNPKLEVARTLRPHKMILINTGSEVLTGSTRLKAGTATKLVLNMLTTLAMVHTGKVLSNLMVDLHPSNAKLRDRAVRLVCELKGCDCATARAALEAADWDVKQAGTRLSSLR
ncbi:MAG: N-acetylmuramic acid 6-phosphate etherase, partial [Verrucomicrobia bacterium]|nr:N-acetylmuramic acid 6-phosphate etherase [Verrucomicrobiota bacterium]